MERKKGKAEEVSQSSGYFETEGARLYYQRWLPKKIRRIMVVAHGLGEHSGRYGNLVEHFVPKGYGIYALDHRGHGRSSGIRGHVSSFLHFRDDLAAFIRKIIEETGHEKVVLVGHSMGGLIAISYSLRYPETLSRLILSSPGLKTHTPPPKIKEKLGKVLARVAPTLLMSNEIDPSHVSRDPKVVKDYVSDPLVHNRVSPKFYVEFLRETARVLQEATWISIPLLLMQAGDDRLVSVGASKEFFAKTGSRKKDLKVYDGHYHEIFNEPEKEQVFGDMEVWLGEDKPQRPVLPKKKGTVDLPEKKKAVKKKKKVTKAPVKKTRASKKKKVIKAPAKKVRMSKKKKKAQAGPTRKAGKPKGEVSGSTRKKKKR